MKRLIVKHITDKRAYALCPWHKDKNPSLDITLEAGEFFGRYYCHGCGKAGTLTKPVMDMILSKKKKGESNKRTNPINWQELSDRYAHDYFWMKVKDRPFDVSFYVLTLLNVGWNGESWTIPLRDENEEIVGIQRRFPDGFKCMVDGSRMGLIIPEIKFDPTLPVYICEGASDTATVLDIAKQAIGRPNNSSCNSIVANWLFNLQGYEYNGPLYIIADNDEVGVKGAIALAEELKLPGNHVLIPEKKDLRETATIHGKEFVAKWLEGNL